MYCFHGSVKSSGAHNVKKILKSAGMHLLNGQSCEIKGVAFVGVKGFIGGFGPRMLASFGEPAVKTMVAEAVSEAMRLENAMRAVQSERAVVVLHYAPILDTVAGEPLEIFPFLGATRLSGPLDQLRPNLAVHGHAHRGTLRGATGGGVPVFNVALPVLRRLGKPLGYLTIDLCSAGIDTSASTRLPSLSPAHPGRCG